MTTERRAFVNDGSCGSLISLLAGRSTVLPSGRQMIVRDPERETSRGWVREEKRVDAIMAALAARYDDEDQFIAAVDAALQKVEARIQRDATAPAPAMPLVQRHEVPMSVWPCYQHRGVLHCSTDRDHARGPKRAKEAGCHVLRARTIRGRLSVLVGGKPVPVEIGNWSVREGDACVRG
jgi:hypothetical protein